MGLSVKVWGAEVDPLIVRPIYSLIFLFHLFQTCSIVVLARDFLLLVLLL